jgi:hypothetical protein
MILIGNDAQSNEPSWDAFPRINWILSGQGSTVLYNEFRLIFLNQILILFILFILFIVFIYTLKFKIKVFSKVLVK